MKQEDFFNKVKALIENGQYDDARAMLSKVAKHPRAQVWLGELDKLEFQRARKAPARRTLQGVLLFLAVLVILSCGFGAFVLYETPTERRIRGTLEGFDARWERYEDCQETAEKYGYTSLEMDCGRHLATPTP